MRRPSLFIVGAPKCGTTSLARWLSAHPQVFMSEPKEPHYFNIDMPFRGIGSRERYLGLFARAPEAAQILGEASTWYLYSDKAALEIEKECPNSRFVVMVRNPIDMAQSLHAHNLRFGHETASSLEEAWRLQDDRAAGRRMPITCPDKNLLLYGRACSLGAQLSRLLDRVSEKRVLTITLDDLAATPATVYTSVLDFLGLADDGRENFPVLNEARAPRSRLYHELLVWGAYMKRRLGVTKTFGMFGLNERRRERTSQPAAFREHLCSFFENDVKILSQVLKRDLSHWLAKQPGG
jgi:hypothetical protein